MVKKVVFIGNYKNKNMPEEIKKSYNPFKMWGSWIVGIIGMVEGFNILVGRISPENINQYFWQSVIGGFFIGFLIGWGIHSLFRKLSK